MKSNFKTLDPFARFGQEVSLGKIGNDIFI